MKKNKVSIITVNFNNELGLLKTTESVLNQKNTSFEYIVIDGGSNDASVQILINNDTKIDYWISEKDSGIYNAMNKGISIATGEYLIFLNSGDCFANEFVLSECLSIIAKNPLVDIFYGDIRIADRPGFAPYVQKHPAQLTLESFADDTINHQACLIKRSLFTEFGNYPEKYRLASDYWLFLSCLIHDKIFQYFGLVVVLYDFTGVSAIDGFKEYKKEQKIIWNALVPAYAQSLLIDKELLLKQNNYYKHLINYKIVKAALKLNSKWQSIRRYFS